ncbi:MAG: aminopeptidase [Ruminococcaceae bacterium]|jgi:aminopeptidase|nr:aminopeptidase [Oscillospiraceae bacterium]
MKKLSGELATGARMVYNKAYLYFSERRKHRSMKKTILRKYARLIAETGVNVQKGQDVFIVAGLDQPDFVRMVAEECYKLGAARVVVDWDYQPLAKVDNKFCSVETLGTLTNYQKARWDYYVEKIPCRIYLDSDDPDGLRGIDQDKMLKIQQMRYPQIKAYRDKLENRYQWCIAAVPGPAWAKKLFPELSKRQAMEKLWEAILATSRVTEDPVAAWEEHNADLSARCAHLNSLGIETLHYTASNGTDFTVGMIPEAEFKGGGDTSLQGIFFNPNIPTEECFISPKRGRAEGIVYASMPLSREGQLIEDFWIRFREGKAVEWHAEKNNQLLTNIITADEGAAYLGECALVPFDSPIQNTGLLFYNTLFDENAACHLALGMGFADTIRGFEEKSLEECRALGVNDSMIHVDFMIGTPDLSIDAVTRDGKTVPIFRNGNWAF